MLKKQILECALNKIKLRRQSAENLAYSFFEKAMLDEQFKNNFKDIKQAEIDNAKAQVYGEEPKYDLKQLKAKQNEILKKLKISPKAIIPHYSCNKCQDTGYVNGEMCSCLKHEINLILFEKSGLSESNISFKKCDFSIFDDTQKIKNIYDKLKKWCEKQNVYQNVILIGKTGTGKTYAMQCMANNLLASESLVYFTSAFELNENLLKYHTTFDETKSDYISLLIDPDYLFIDDLGTEPILKNVTREGLYNIISERMRKGKKTVISSNLSPDQIKDVYGERIFSRLFCQNTALVIHVENSDLRLKK